MKKTELSILIPVYNYDCRPLVLSLFRLTTPLLADGVLVELIVADDGSSDSSVLQANATLSSNPLCRYIRRQENCGRAAIRNFLAQESKYQWLLFLDCDMQLPDDNFLSTYLNSEGEEVIDGGFAVLEQPDQEGHNLRYTYELSEQTRHSAEQRRANPYRSFRTTNFLIRRDIMLAHPFDERFLHYGYEDVLFGKQLHLHHIGICHIDNPMMLADLEPNPLFMDKTEEALRTLYQFRADLRGYSRLLTFVEGIHIGLVRMLLRLCHRVLGPLERHLLCGSRPSLRLFKLYKLGYYLNIN